MFGLNYIIVINNKKFNIVCFYCPLNGHIMGMYVF